MAEVLAPELRTDAELLCLGPDLGFHFEVAERMAARGSVYWKIVEVLGTRVLRHLECVLRAGPAHDNREVVRRAGGGAELA